MGLDTDLAAASGFARLNTDAVQQIAALLPVSSLLTLTAVSHELGRTFCPAVLSLAVSKVSLRTASLPHALRGLSRRYPMLCDLDLSDSAAGDAEVAFVAGSFPSLTRLSLEGCDAVSDVALAKLAAQLPQLLTLQLLGCRDVSDRGIARLVPRCASLRALHLGWCDISDRGLAIVSRLGTSLTFIDLSGCARVSDRGVRQLVTACRHLASMHLEGCRELSGWVREPLMTSDGL